MNYLFFLFSIVTIGACSKPNADIQKLDPATVNYQMTATVNGQTWTSANADNSNRKVTWVKDSSRTVPTWKIFSFNANANQSIELLMITKTFYLNQVYGLSYPLFANEDGYYPTFYFNTFVYGGANAANIAFPRAEARLRFTKFDGEKMSGTFDFKLGRYVSPGVWDSVVVTNGVFTDVTRE